MPNGVFTDLKTLVVGVTRIENWDHVPDELVKYDTQFTHTDFYPIDKTKVHLLIFLLSIDIASGYKTLWTTIRPWTSAKEAYYRRLIGQFVLIELDEKGNN